MSNKTLEQQVEDQVKLSQEILQLYLYSAVTSLDPQHQELLNLAIARLTTALQPIKFYVESQGV